jgi:hypothetical protein
VPDSNWRPLQHAARRPLGRLWVRRRRSRIVRYDDIPVYLLYLDAAGEKMTDTWHQALDDAMQEGEFEFPVAPWPVDALRRRL